MKKTFRGGVHPEGHKELSRDCALKAFDPKGEMVFPLSMHIGKPAKPVVQKGDEVKVGQMLAEADGFVSAHVFSSCSGKVKAVEDRRVLTGQQAPCIVIENDGSFTPADGFGDERDVDALSGADIVKAVKDAGIVGLGGAGFPTNVKLAPRNADEIRYIIANGAECEPYITCDDQLMRTKSAEIVTGMEVILSLFPQAEGVIVIEDNKPEAIAAMEKACQGAEKVRVQVVPVKYPQGGERSIIHVVAGVDIKASQLPADAGCIVDNVATIYAIYRAVCESTPLMEKAVTITGEAVADPCNLIVRIGTNIAELIEAAGGVKEGTEAKKVLSGGPMMGIAMADLNVPLQKSNNAVTVLAFDEVEAAEAVQTACIRCGRCNHSCPLGLNPQLMSIAAERKEYDRYENKLYGLECISCGSCTFICPAKRPLMQLFKEARNEILSAKAVARAEAAKAKMEAEQAEEAARQAEIRTAVEAALRAADEERNLVKASEAEKRLAASMEASDDLDVPVEKEVKTSVGANKASGGKEEKA